MKLKLALSAGQALALFVLLYCIILNTVTVCDIHSGKTYEKDESKKKILISVGAALAVTAIATFL